MFYGDKVEDTRQMFFSSWYKYQEQKPLTALEKQIVEVIIIHPEYHRMLEGDIQTLEATHFPELGQENPFLHMGLHLAIRDQVATDSPPGIREVYQQLQARYQDISAIEHMLMEPLADCLWQARRYQQMPDDRSYLNACRALLT